MKSRNKCNNNGVEINTFKGLFKNLKNILRYLGILKPISKFKERIVLLVNYIGMKCHSLKVIEEIFKILST